jgi:hypothetical protein
MGLISLKSEAAQTSCIDIGTIQRAASGFYGGSAYNLSLWLLA